jgi:Ser/Thr protein kinase RdoA (MazF antagonist)
MDGCTVVTSVIAPDSLNEYLAGTYPALVSCHCQLLKTGINHTYKVVGEDTTYIFRIYCYAWRTEEAIQAEIDWLLKLHSHQLPVATPIADKSGRYIQYITAPEGKRFGVLFTLAPGEKLQQYAPEMHEQAGILLANIHQLGRSGLLNRPYYQPEALLDQGLRKIMDFLPHTAQELQYLQKLKAFLLNQFNDAAFQNLETGIVHMDMWFDNLNISHDGKITLFDFDFCGNGWLAFDIAYYQLQLFNTEKTEQDRKKKQLAFREGYQSVRPFPVLSDTQWAALSLSMYYFYLGIQCSRFHDWSASFLNETYLKRYIEVFVKGYQAAHFKID